ARSSEFLNKYANRRDSWKLHESCNPDLPMMSTKLHLHENLTQTETLPEFLLAGFGETTSRGCQALSQKVPL
ncbi:mCG1028418, partial [Mus musculus]